MDYNPQIVHVCMTFNPVILKGSASAFWLRLSTLDNLVATAFQTRQRTVFDEFNRLVAKDLGPYLMKHNAVPANMLRSRTQKVVLGVNMDPKTAIIVLIASAHVNDIEKMEQARKRESSGGVSTWRKILALSLQSFAAGAKGYSDAYANSQRAAPPQTVFNSRRTCYTNFIGGTAFTNCY